MRFKVAINGYGRIGQSVLRAIYSSPYRSKFEIVAINELADIETLTYLTRYDTTHGRFPYPLNFNGEFLYINQEPVRIINQQAPGQIDWRELAADLVFECSGSFHDRLTADIHVRNGAKRLLISHPAIDSADATIVYGFNHHTLQPNAQVVSNASCTTNCLVPILNLLNETYGIENGVTTTIHSAMNDQPVIDSYNHSNLRLSRSALQSIIPVDTGLAKGINKLLPQLAGSFECLHIRVPTINVSLMDISVNLRKSTNPKEINDLLRVASEHSLHDILGYSEEPHASVDFNGDPRSAIIDGTQTRVSNGRLVKLIAWFDNEWGFANRMLDVANYWLSLPKN